MTTLATVAWIDTTLSHHAIPYWIFGGFAVDLHVGEMTRAHGDVDVAVREVDFARAAELLAGAGWTRTSNADQGYATFDRMGETVDLAPVALDDPSWPAGAFGEDVGELAGVRAHVITREALVADKQVRRDDPTTRAKDAADVRRLAPV